MTRQRFVLLHRDGLPPREDLERLTRGGVEILDDSGRALLVAASRERIDELRRELPGWTITEEREHRAPSPRLPRVEREPERPS